MPVGRPGSSLACSHWYWTVTVSLPDLTTVVYGRGLGVAVRTNVLWSKNSRCCSASEAEPAPTCTQYSRQSPVWPRPASCQDASPAGSGWAAIAADTVSAAGPSDGEQVSGVAGGDPGGFQPHPAATRPSNSTRAISARSGMHQRYGSDRLACSGRPAGRGVCV